MHTLSECFDLLFLDSVAYEYFIKVVINCAGNHKFNHFWINDFSDKYCFHYFNQRDHNLKVDNYILQMVFTKFVLETVY